jgi:hypothetical protein
MLDQKTVKELFTYHPFAGILYKNSRLSQKPIRARYVWIAGKQYTTASIIWLWVTGTHNPYVRRLDKNYKNNHWLNFA